MIKENKTTVWQTSGGYLHYLVLLICQKFVYFAKYEFKQFKYIAVGHQNLESDENCLH